MYKEIEMIVARKITKEFIKAQNNITEFAKELEVSRETVYNLLNDESVSSDMVAKILTRTGFDFEKAFEVKGWVIYAFANVVNVSTYIYQLGQVIR